MNPLALIAAVLLAGVSAKAEEPRIPIPPGYRAINLTFDDDQVYYVSPGDMGQLSFVMPASSSEPTRHGGSVSHKWDYASVLNVAPSETELNKSVVQLAVGPGEAQTLGLLASSGKAWFSLRTKGDREDCPIPLSSWEEFFGKLEIRPGANALHERYGDASGAAVKSARPFHRSAAGVETLAAVKSRMSEGYRALSVPIDSDQALFVRPGDHIDVLVTLQAKRGSSPEEKMTMTLAQDVLVLDRRESEVHPGRSILLLALNCLNVQYATLAWETAEVRISLRGESDAEAHPMQPFFLSR